MSALPDSLEIACSVIKPDDLLDTPRAREQVNHIIHQLYNRQISTEEAKELAAPFMRDTSKIGIIGEMLMYISQTPGVDTIPTPGTRKKSTPWTQEEDQKLKEAVDAYGCNNWGAVVSVVGNGRTRSQCAQRWNRVIDPRISKANWTTEEEEKLLRVVEKYGTKQWTRVAAEMGNRSDVQCRFKYKFIMDKKKKPDDPMQMTLGSIDTSSMLPTTADPMTDN